MTDELTTVPPILPTVRATLTETSFAMADDASESEYWQAGRAIGRMAQANLWYLGDWANSLADRGYGDLKRAAEVTGAAYNTLRQATSVASRVCTRVHTLSWHHHQLVAKYDVDEQAVWLADAVAGRWTVRQLRDEMRAAERQAAVDERLAELDEAGATVLAGDAATVMATIPAGTIDAIITDPPYPKEYLGVYGELAAEAARVLRPGGTLAVMVGQSYLPDVLAAMVPHIRYHWTLAYMTPGGQAVQLWDRKVNTFWKPVLWFVNGRYEGDWIGDVARSQANDNDKSRHEWGQSESGMADLIERLTRPGDHILDPFSGGATTGVMAVRLGRRYTGIDINPALSMEAAS